MQNVETTVVHIETGPLVAAPELGVVVMGRAGRRSGQSGGDAASCPGALRVRAHDPARVLSPDERDHRPRRRELSPLTSESVIYLPVRILDDGGHVPTARPRERHVRPPRLRVVLMLIAGRATVVHSRACDSTSRCAATGDRPQRLLRRRVLRRARRRSSRCGDSPKMPPSSPACALLITALGACGAALAAAVGDIPGGGIPSSASDSVASTSRSSPFSFRRGRAGARPSAPPASPTPVTASARSSVRCWSSSFVPTTTDCSTSRSRSAGRRPHFGQPWAHRPGRSRGTSSSDDLVVDRPLTSADRIIPFICGLHLATWRPRRRPPGGCAPHLREGRLLRVDRQRCHGGVLARSRTRACARRTGGASTLRSSTRPRRTSTPVSRRPLPRWRSVTSAARRTPIRSSGSRSPWSIPWRSSTGIRHCAPATMTASPC